MKDRARRTLVVDPDPLFAGKLSALLISHGYDVEGAEGITTAVQRLKDVHFDCVIMDEDLPEIKGHDAVAILRAISPEAPIIMTTAWNSTQLEQRIRRQDIFYYYVKSFDMHELLMAVRDAFRKIGKEEAARPTDRPARILIVDDDQDFAAATESILERYSYEVSTARNKDEALEMVQSVKPDLVLIGIVIERLSDGLAICKKLKYDRELRHIPVLVVSSITEKTGLKFPIRNRIEDFAADDYLEKPVRAADLLRHIEKLLS